MTSERDRDRDLTPAERDALASLRDDAAPPPHLKGQVVNRLAADGQLAGVRPVGWFRPAAAAAVLAVTFASGWVVGQRRAGPAAAHAPDEPHYALLLVDGGGDSAPSGADVEAFREWSLGLHADDRLILAERLGSEGWLETPQGTERAVPLPEVSGLFVVKASSPEEASAIARSSPQLSRGGAIAVRRIGPT